MVLQRQDRDSGVSRPNTTTVAIRPQVVIAEGNEFGRGIETELDKDKTRCIVYQRGHSDGYIFHDLIISDADSCDFGRGSSSDTGWS